MISTWIDIIRKADGTVERRRMSAKGPVLEPVSRERHSGKPCGRYHTKSSAMGFIGTKKQLRQQMARDARMGCPINYEATIERNGKAAYAACFETTGQMGNFMRKNEYVNHDGALKCPVPGDFVGR